MTGKEFDKVFEEQVQSCRDIMLKKGPDYDDGKDRLSNFKVVAGMVGVDPKIVWAVYAAKHFLAIMNYCGKGRVESEPIGGRISDLINYGHLLNALEAEKLQPKVTSYIGEMDATKIQVMPTFPDDINGYVDILKAVPPHDTPLTMSFAQAVAEEIPEGIDLRVILPEPPPTLNLWERLKQLASS